MNSRFDTAKATLAEIIANPTSQAAHDFDRLVMPLLNRADTELASIAAFIVRSFRELPDLNSLDHVDQQGLDDLAVSVALTLRGIML